MRTRRLPPVQIDDPAFRAMIVRIERMTPREMRAVFARLFGRETSSGNGAWLRRRIIRRLEEIELSHMMPEALRCAEEIATDLRGKIALTKSAERALVACLVAARGSDRVAEVDQAATHEWRFPLDGTPP